MSSHHPFLGVVALALATSGCSGERLATGDRLWPDAASDAWRAEAGRDGATDGANAGLPHVIRVTTANAASVDDGMCSLTEAIAASNGRQAVNTGDCPAGTGHDVIELPPGTYPTTTTLAFTESVELRGGGRGLSTITFAGDDLTCGVRLAALGKTIALTSVTLRPAADGPVPSAMTGVCLTGGTARLRHARVSGFTAGGLRAEAPPGGHAHLEIFNSLVDGNTSRGDGAGVAFVGADSSISIDQSSLVNNASDGMGGGLFAAGGTNANYILNSTFSGNLARRGGGIAARILDFTYFGLYWSTIAHNRATDIAGGLHIEAEGLSAHGTTTDTIIVGNIADGDSAQANLNADWAPGLSCASSIFHLSALPRRPPNLADSCRFDISDVRLGPLMDMGGADHLPMHGLLPGSPAIDAVADRRPLDILEQRDTWNGGIGDPPLGTSPGETPPWSLFGRDGERNLLSDVGAYEFNPRWEFELLVVASRSPPAPAVISAGTGGFSHGAAVDFSASAPGQFVTYQVPVPEAGRHAISVRMRTSRDGGTFQLLVSDAVGGPYLPIGALQDGYSAVEEGKTVELGTADFSAPGQKFFKFLVTERNGDSSGSRLVLDYLTVTRP